MVRFGKKGYDVDCLDCFKFNMFKGCLACPQYNGGYWSYGKGIIRIQVMLTARRILLQPVGKIITNKAETQQ